MASERGFASLILLSPARPLLVMEAQYDELLDQNEAEECPAMAAKKKDCQRHNAAERRTVK